MRNTANDVPNKSWKETVLKEFGMTSENVRTIDVLGGEFYDCYMDVQFAGDFIFFLKAGKIVKIFEYDLSLVMEDENGIKICKKEVEFFVGASGQIVMPYEISSSDF